ncbi:tyrosine-protein phosphatase [Microbacterium suwonense]|uniref:Phosphotyrosine protein phosphatase n=1 Tax=Microbacterium suwonense TaxID=683047 RepID=A0ABM8FT29_9MICO|nr:tyrosine-protein phosphatase [Microbacterium suwonense]BDZ38690.1 putative phosphotyrosine protein phosphatase [Microbacterium suwonense]
MVTVIRVPGVDNLRDVGGIPVGAARVRPGVLLRSGKLAGLTPAGRAMLSERVRRVVDLRDDAEVEAEPSVLRSVPITRVPLFLGSVGSFFEQNMDLAAMYRHLVDESARRLVEAVRVIAAGEPTLVHCTVGKDRTGVTVALALSAVGADRDAVVADYAFTASQLPVERNRAVVEYFRTHLTDARNAIQLATESPAPVMAALLAGIDERYGSVADYLQSAGLTDAELAALHDALID